MPRYHPPPQVWHNYAFDRHVLYNHMVDVQGFGGDTMHMARLWDASRKTKGGYSLSVLTEEVVGRRKVPRSLPPCAPLSNPVPRSLPSHAPLSTTQCMPCCLPPTGADDRDLR